MTQGQERALSLAALGLVALMAAQLVLTAQAKSATMDEQVHIARGLSYLRTGDLRLIREHPPLVGMLSALPLAWDRQIRMPLHSWEAASTYVFADELLWKANANGPTIVLRARGPIIVLSLLLALVVFLWAREMFGPWAGLLALALTSFDPNLLAHGCLATNDVGVTCFATLAAYLFWRLLRQATWTRAALAGGALGLALAAKFSAVFLIPSFAVMALIETRSRRKPWTSFAAVAATAAITVWAVYGFELYPYFAGFRAFVSDVQGGMPAFLLGRYSTTGWWYYFPVAFLVKTPIPTMLLVGAAAKRWRQGLIVLAPALIYSALTLTSRMNLGYRHLLPILPFLFVFASRLASFGWREAPRRAALAGVLLVWLVAGTAWTFPHYLAYFNETAAARRHEILVDSNLDWGQDLPALREYMTHEGLSSIRLSYFGSALPQAYGVSYEPLPSFPRHSEATPEQLARLENPPPGTYAISATNLAGVPFADHDLYSWFRAREPDAVIGQSILVYVVEDRD